MLEICFMSMWKISRLQDQYHDSQTLVFFVRCPATPLFLVFRHDGRGDLQGQGTCHAKDKTTPKTDHVESMVLLLNRSGASFSIKDAWMLFFSFAY